MEPARLATLGPHSVNSTQNLREGSGHMWAAAERHAQELLLSCSAVKARGHTPRRSMASGRHCFPAQRMHAGWLRMHACRSTAKLGLLLRNKAADTRQREAREGAHSREAPQ